ncbi:MAG: ferrous iron transport protein B [Chlorobi bacterium]|nr:ferrous iron transport protein B [Chlorobiota bacterium]
MKLSDIKNKETVVITKVLGHGSFRKRINEMGFIKGKQVRVLNKTPFNGPIEYKILNYNISLRHSEAELIEVIPIKDFKEPATSNYSGVINRNVIPNEVQAGNKTINIALVGNPNCGKTTLYNYISGAKEKVGNYSGVTVDIKMASVKLKGYTLNFYDLPGTYSLTAYSPEEIYVRKFIYEQTPDIIINVLDASNIERNLFLTTQLIDMDVRVVVALNMFDELKKQSLSTNYNSLAKLVGIPFIPTVSSKGTGLKKLLNKVIEVFEGKDEFTRHIHINYGKEIERSIGQIRKKIQENKPITDKISSRFIAIKLLEKDQQINELLSKYPNFEEIKSITEKEIKRIELLENEDSESIITDAKYGFIAGALKETFNQPRQALKTRSEKIDHLLTHQVWGFPIFILLLVLVFYATFKLGVYPMNWIDMGIAQIAGFVSSILGEGMLRDLLVNGIISGTGSVLVFLPNILILFFFISLLEGTGYMARAAFIMDKIMHRFGLHGRSFIPLIMGFGCNVPAILATRTLRNKGDRILTMLIIPFMSCSARLPVYILIISAFFQKYQALYLAGIYLIGIAIAFLTAQLLNKTIFRNKETPFVMELPAYRMPTLRNILYHMWDKTHHYLKKIGSVILIGVIIIWALEYFPRETGKSAEFKARIEKIESNSVMDNDEKEAASQLISREMEANRLANSYLGRIGDFIQPAMRPLGFDWKMSISLLAGLPAKEVIVSTMGVLYQSGKANTVNLQKKLRDEVYTYGEYSGNRVFNNASALAFLIFILIYFPCIGVIATIKNESGHWKWAIFTVFYTTGLAWLAAFAVYQVGSMLV